MSYEKAKDNFNDFRYGKIYTAKYKNYFFINRCFFTNSTVNLLLIKTQFNKL